MENKNFYSNINEYYDFIFKANQNQVDFINSFTSPMGNILDVGCGTGSLAIKLSSSDRKVSAIDFDPKMIERALEKKIDSNVSFEQMDMLEISDGFKNDKFDTIYCFGNTLAHLTSLSKISSFCKSSYNLLGKGGNLLIQVVNFDKVLANNISSLPLIDNENVKFERYYSLEKSNGLIEFKTKLTSKSNTDELNNSIKLYPIKKDELKDILEDIGFLNIEFYSNFKKNNWSIDGMPTIIKCTK